MSALIRYWVSIEDRLALCLIRAIFIMMKLTLFSGRPTHLATVIHHTLIIHHTTY